MDPMTRSRTTEIRSEDIPCMIDCQPVKERVLKILAQIRSFHPTDYERLRNRVTLIECAKSYFENPDTMELHCEFVEDECCIQNIDESTDEIISCEIIVPCVLPINVTELTAVVAHELGHACTTSLDVATVKCPVDSWAHELVANYYAYKWGFEREIRATAPKNHGMPGGIANLPPCYSLPGSQIYDETARQWYFITPNFVWAKGDRTTLPNPEARRFCDPEAPLRVFALEGDPARYYWVE